MNRHSLLKPVKRHLPICENFSDETKVIEFERAMRIHRAHVESFHLIAPKQGPFGPWRVAGDRGKSYWVDFLESGFHNSTCNCPDFLANNLGTCKHLEAVRRFNANKKGFSTSLHKKKSIEKEPTLTFDGMAGRLHIHGKLDESTLDSLGLKVIKGRLELNRPAWPRREDFLDYGINVTHGAAIALEREAERLRRSMRRRDLQCSFANGSSGVDVLKIPLFQYQQEGVRHLAANGRALLADDMGLGKTVQAIAAYEALASSIKGRLAHTPESGHSALVAAVFKELIPSGRLPLAVPGALARLHDLTMLDQHGVELEWTLAKTCVEEADSWVERLAMAEDN